jgi:hypothetical protein
LLARGNDCIVTVSAPYYLREKPDEPARHGV